MSFQGILGVNAEENQKRNKMQRQNFERGSPKRHKSTRSPDVTAYILEAVSGAKETGRLRLAKLDLRELPQEVTDIREHVTELILSENSMIRVPDLSGFHRLEILDLSYNDIRELPEEDLMNLRQLHHIYIVGNPVVKDQRYREYRNLALYFHTKAKERQKILDVKNKGGRISNFFCYFAGILGKKAFGPRTMKKMNKEIERFQLDYPMKIKGIVTKRSMRVSDFTDLSLNKFTMSTSTFKGYYNDEHTAAIRPIYLRRAEKHAFLDAMTSISLWRNSNVARIIAIIKYSRRQKDIQLELDSEKVIESGPYPIFILTEYMHPMTLKNWIASPDFECASIRKKLDFARQIAKGMRALHYSEPPIIHHNLHTNNVLFTNSNMTTLKVSDYFLGNRIKRDLRPYAENYSQSRDRISADMEVEVTSDYEDENNTTGPGLPNRSGDTTDDSDGDSEEGSDDLPQNSPRGILAYHISPELARNEEYDEKIDVYSYGILLWELFTGQCAAGMLSPSLEAKDGAVIRPKIPTELPENLKLLITRCWDVDPKFRPNFVEILTFLDEVDIECVVSDADARQWWLYHMSGKESIEWSRFIVTFFDTWNIKSQEETEKQKSLHKTLVNKSIDGDDMVALESFGKMILWFGPWDRGILNRVDEMYQQLWFFGAISDEQANDMLISKVRGTFLVRFSPRNPGNFVLSITEDGHVIHVEISHAPTMGYEISGCEYDSLSSLISHQTSNFNLRFTYPKDQGDIETMTWKGYTEDSGFKTPLSLKELIFRFVYSNSQIFPEIKQVIPHDLFENYRDTVVDFITPDPEGRRFWKSNFLEKEHVKPQKLTSALIKTFLDSDIQPELSEFYRPLVALISDISEPPNLEFCSKIRVNVESFGKLLEWFGPLDREFFSRAKNVVQMNSFHGTMSHEQAEKHIRHQSSGKKGTFLVRISPKFRGFFLITVVGRRKALLHYRVEYRQKTQEYVLGRRAFHQLEDAITISSRDLCLFYPCPQSKFDRQGIQKASVGMEG